MVTDVSLKLTVQNVTLSFGKAYWVLLMSTDIVCVLECISKLLKRKDTILSKNVYHDAAAHTISGLPKTQIFYVDHCTCTNNTK